VVVVTWACSRYGLGQKVAAKLAIRSASRRRLHAQPGQQM
jgi:hypothetical protein